MNKKYPREFSDDELKDQIDKYADAPVNSLDNVPYFTKASLGLVELQGRQNSKLTKLSLFVAFLALIVSLIGIYK